MADEEKAETTYGFEGNSPLIRATRAMYGQMVESVRQHAASLDLQHERLRRVFLAARSEADRSAAILMFALAEDLMLDAIKRYCNSDVKGSWEEITGGNGLLATANDRITFLYLLEWIHPNVYSDLRLLKSIRNRFAHHADVSNFEDSKIKSWIAAMKINEGFMLTSVSETDLPRPETFTTRQMFLMRSSLVITRLVSNLAIAPEARASRVAPGYVEGRDWDLYPDNLKELNRIAAEAVIDILQKHNPGSNSPEISLA